VKIELFSPMSDEAIIDTLNMLIEKNGLEYEMGVMIEEMSELTKELTKHLRHKGNRMRLIEEMSDVILCTMAMIHWMKIDSYDLQTFFQYKVARLSRFYLETGESK